MLEEAAAGERAHQPDIRCAGLDEARRSRARGRRGGGRFLAGAAAPPSGICRTLVKGPTVTFSWDGPQDDVSPVLRERRRVQLWIGDEIPPPLRRPALARLAGADLGRPRALRLHLPLAPPGYTLFQGACKAKSNPKIAFVWTLALG